MRYAWAVPVLLFLAGCATPRTAHFSRHGPFHDFSVVRSSGNWKLTTAELDQLQAGVEKFLAGQGLVRPGTYLVRIEFPPAEPGQVAEWVIVKLTNAMIPDLAEIEPRQSLGPDAFYYAYDDGFGYPLFGYDDPFDFAILGILTYLRQPGRITRPVTTGPGTAISPTADIPAAPVGIIITMARGPTATVTITPRARRGTRLIIRIPAKAGEMVARVIRRRRPGHIPAAPLSRRHLHRPRRHRPRRRDPAAVRTTPPGTTGINNPSGGVSCARNRARRGRRRWLGKVRRAWRGRP